MKYSIVTFGCRVNQADSLVIEEQLQRHGLVETAPAHADLVVVNTCSVTATADQGARQTIRRIVRDNPHVKVVVTGCYATRRPGEIGELPNVVRVIGNDRKDDLVEALDAAGDLSTVRSADGDGPCGSLVEPGFAGRTTLTLRVQTGCDEACSYCVIPTTRGTGRSRSLSDAIAHMSRAVDAGYREIVLTGVHLGSYGRDLGDGTTLASLVRILSEWPEEVLFRISSLEPMDCTPAIVAAAASARIAPHFHLPLQHGSDQMLRAMNRPYTAEYFRDLVERIKRVLPDASIGTDLIVGFPGESNADFAQTVEVVSALPLAYLHVFPYSDRPGTVASRLSNKVDGNTIRSRGRTLRDIGHAKAATFRRSQEGRTVRALTVDDGWSAVTGNYLKVRLDEPRPRNSWVSITL